MNKKYNQIDYGRMLIYIFQYLWLVILCAEIGFATYYLHITRNMPETFTASGTMYVNNGNPNLSDYQYTNASDLNSAVQLIKTYLVVVQSDKVMDVVTERLIDAHPGITSSAVSSTLSMESVSETGVVAVKSTTTEPRLSADIVNAVMEIAPEEIIRVVGAGNVEILDYATVPVFPNKRNAVSLGLRKGATIGAGVAVVFLAFLFMLNQKVNSTSDLKERYEFPVLASIKRVELLRPTVDSFLLSNNSAMEIIESYAKLRMNLIYALVGSDKNTVVVTSSISGEGKSTIAANLAISLAISGKNILLVDGDMRRASQTDIFHIGKHSIGLSDTLASRCTWQEAVYRGVRTNIDLLPAGHIPPNPAELLESLEMIKFLQEVGKCYDMILLDMPPVNIVADPLAISSVVSGCLYVVRQGFTDQRDIRKGLSSAELTGMRVLGFVFYGETIHDGSYYGYRYYRKYYNKYDYRRNSSDIPALNVDSADETAQSSDSHTLDCSSEDKTVKGRPVKDKMTEAPVSDISKEKEQLASEKSQDVLEMSIDGKGKVTQPEHDTGKVISTHVMTVDMGLGNAFPVSYDKESVYEANNDESTFVEPMKTVMATTSSEKAVPVGFAPESMVVTTDEANEKMRKIHEDVPAASITKPILSEQVKQSASKIPAERKGDASEMFSSIRSKASELLNSFHKR